MIMLGERHFYNEYDVINSYSIPKVLFSKPYLCFCFNVLACVCEVTAYVLVKLVKYKKIETTW